MQPLRSLARRLGIALPASALTWQSYLRGQGTLLFCFLLFGAALGWLSMKYGSVEGQVAIEGKLIEYRGVNIAEHPAYEEIDATGYGRISVFTKVLLPPASKVNIRVIPDESKPEERMSFQGTDSSWMRMEERVSTKHLTLVIENAEAGAAKASQVDVLVFLGKR